VRSTLPATRCESAAGSVPHLATRRLRSGAHRCLDGVDWRALEDGRLRFRASVASAFSERNQDSRAMAACARRLLDRLRVARGVGSTRPQADDRLSVDQPSRLLHARSLRRDRDRCAAFDRDPSGVERCVPASLQSRHHRGRVVLLRRVARTTSRTAWHQRFRRTDATDPLALRVDERRHVSSLGLPGLNGFIGEFLIFKGSFALAASFTAIAVIGLLVTAIAFARAMQTLFSGPLAESCRAFPDLLRSERLVVVPVTLLMFAI